MIISTGYGHQRPLEKVEEEKSVLFCALSIMISRGTNKRFPSPYPTPPFDDALKGNVSLLLLLFSSFHMDNILMLVHDAYETRVSFRGRRP